MRDRRIVVYQGPQIIDIIIQGNQQQECNRQENHIILVRKKAKRGQVKEK